MADSEWKKGDEVLYCKDDLESGKTPITRKGKIVDLDRDDNLNPYYVIRLDYDGSERHTIAKYLKHPIKEDKEKQTIVSSDDTATKPPPPEKITQVVETTKPPADITSNNKNNESVDLPATLSDPKDSERNQSFTDKTEEPEKNVMSHHQSNIMSRPLSQGIPSPVPQTNISPPTPPPPLQLSSSPETPSTNETSLTNDILAQTTPLNDDSNSQSDKQPWKVGDDVLYSNDDEFKLTREATVIRIDDDSIFGTFYVIKFKDDETQRIALPKRLHPLGTSPTTNDDNDWVNRENFLKHHFPTEKNDPKNENEANTVQIQTQTGPPPEAFTQNRPNQQIRTSSGSISPMTRQMMKSALVAHQKNKMQLRKQSEIIEMNKRSTNRERIQAAMKNLGQPVQEPKNITKSASLSSMASELSSDMVQRFAIFQNDDDENSSDDEQSEITAPIRNSHKSSSPMDIHSRPTIEQSKRPSSFRLFKNRSFLKNKVAAAKDTQSECQVGGKKYRKTSSSEPDTAGTDTDLEEPLPMATEIIESLDGQKPKRRLSMPTIVKDIPNRRAYFPSFKSQKDKQSSHVYPMSPDEGLPIAIASNVSEMTSLGGSQENRSLLSKMSSEKKKESRHKLIIALLAVIFAVSIGFVAVLAVLQVRQNKLSNGFSSDGDIKPIDNGKSKNPKIRSESYIQAFWGIDLSPLDSNQVTIWQTIMEDYASDFLANDEKELVSTKCVINFQVHESSVSWNRNRHRKKKKNEENPPAARHRNLALQVMNEVSASNNTDYTSINVDFTLTFSTVSNDIDLDDYPTIFLERINSDNVKKNILMKLQGRLQLAVEDIDDIYLRNENGSKVFLFTAPTLKPTLRPTQSPSTSPSLRPSVSPSRLPTSAISRSPSSSPSSQPSPPPTPSPTNQPTPRPRCCAFHLLGHCLISC